MSAHLELTQLSKVFGAGPEAGREALQQSHSKAELLASSGYVIGVRDVSLHIEPGELFVVMGLSGSGKSTLVRMINRLIEPTAGRVMLEGVDVTAMSTRELVALRRDKMSMVFQSFALLPHLTVIDNVAFGLRVSGVDKKEARRRAQQALQLVGIPEVSDQRPDQLSGGMQQRAGLARAWVTEPRIMLMDEAFSALDPLIRSEMQDQLVQLQEKLHKTIIFITHDLDEALRLGDRIAILKDGEVVQQGEPEEILLHPATDYVEAFVRDVNRARALTVETVMKDPAYRITADTISGALQQMKGFDRDYGYIVTDEGYQGTVKAAKLEQAYKANKDADLTDALYEQIEPVEPQAVLETVIPNTLDADYPLPVVDEQGQLAGCLTRGTLAEVLGSEHKSEADKPKEDKDTKTSA